MNDDKIQLAKKFQMYCSEYIAQMLEIDPKNVELDKYNRKFHLLCNANPFKPLELFHQWSLTCRDEILNENMKYFLKLSSTSSTSSGLDNESLMDVLKLCELWKSLSAEEKKTNKKVIFQYMKMLLLISDKYMALDNNNY